MLLKLSQVQAALSKFDLAHNDIRMNAKALCSVGLWAHLLVTLLWRKPVAGDRG